MSVQNTLLKTVYLQGKLKQASPHRAPVNNDVPPPRPDKIPNFE